MKSYSVAGKKFIINELNIADVHSGALREIDKLYYPAFVIWGKTDWLNVLNKAFYKIAVREVKPTETTLIGNLVVTIGNGVRSANPAEYSFHIDSLTIHNKYLRQGHATHMLEELAEQMQGDRNVGLRSHLHNITVNVPRDRPLYLLLCDMHGFKKYSEARNAIRFTMSVSDFLNMLTKSSSTADQETADLSSAPAKPRLSLKA